MTTAAAPGEGGISGKVYYGWYVLVAAALSEMLAIGATSYAAGLFVLPVQAEFGLSRANASSSILIIIFGAIFLAPFAGKILDRYSIRLVMVAGALVFSAALAVIALSSSLWVIVLSLLIPGAAGFIVLGPMTTATLASRWFYRRRGLAQGLAALATSGGGLLVVPALSKAIQMYGWRGALLAEAAVMFVAIALLALFVLRDSPLKSGLSLHPENLGRAGAGRPGQTETTETMRWRDILGAPGFWAPSLLVAMMSGMCEAEVIAASPYGRQLGFAIAASAFLISAFSVCAALAKILAGVLADHLDIRLLLFVSALFLPASLALLCASTSYAATIAAFCLAGVALGGVLPTSASLLAGRFGAARFGAVMGWTYAFIGIATIAAVRFLGVMFDRTGGYRAAFLGLLVICLAVLLIALLIDLRSRRAQ